MYGRDRAGASRGASCHMASRSNFWSGDGSPRPHPPVPPPPRRHETYVAWRRDVLRGLCPWCSVLLVPNTIRVSTPTRAERSCNASSETRHKHTHTHTHTEETTGTLLPYQSTRRATRLCGVGVSTLESPFYDEYRTRRSTRNAAVTAATAARACAPFGEASKSKSGLV